ncbi:MAG: thiamine pyrophosphate-binding protein, partial [Candidatus Puniceispirillaceae bacterium]
YPGRISGTSLENPDFVAVANAYGLAGKKVSTTTEFAAAFETVNNSETGGVIELDISVEAITPARSLSEISGKA